MFRVIRIVGLFFLLVTCLLPAAAADLVILSGQVKTTQGVVQPGAKLSFTIMNCASDPSYNGTSDPGPFLFTANNSGAVAGTFPGTPDISCGSIVYYRVKATTALGVVLWARNYQTSGSVFNVTSATQLTVLPPQPSSTGTGSGGSVALGPACISTVNPAMCGASTYGFISIPIPQTNILNVMVINTTAVTATNAIYLQYDNSKAGNCMSDVEVATSVGIGGLTILSRVPGVSFSILSGYTASVPTCLTFSINANSGATGLTGAASTVAGPPGAPGMTYRGAYSSAVTYVAGDVVSSAGSSYISVVSSNTNNAPDASPTQWGVLAAQGAASGSAITLQHSFTAAGTFSYTHSLGTSYPLMTCYVNSGSPSYTANNVDVNHTAITVNAASDITCTFGK